MPFDSGSSGRRNRPSELDPDLPGDSEALPPTDATADSAGPTRGVGLRPSTFLRAVVASVGQQLNRPDQEFQSHARSRLAKFWFGPDDSIHFEIWIHERSNQLELGLHFEADPDLNHELYRRFDKCLFEIQARLGTSIWLEDWDKGWVRIYETQPLWPLDGAKVESVVSRMCDIITTLQPIYEAIRDDLAHPLGDAARATLRE